MFKKLGNAFLILGLGTCAFLLTSSEMGKESRSVDDYLLVVKQNKALLARGEKLEARFYMVKSAEGIDPVFYLDDETVPKDEETGIYTTTAGAQGKFEKTVIAEVQNPKTGVFKTYEASLNYQVFSGDATISGTKNNILYQGLDNPIEISVPGFEPSKINATLSPASIGTLIKVSPGKYLARIKRRDKNGCKINVSAESNSGQVLMKGAMLFKTLKMPTPTAYLLKKTGGQITVADLDYVSTIEASLPNFAFEGLEHEVSAYSYKYIGPKGTIVSGEAEGAEIASELKSAFTGAKVGDLFIISQIKALRSETYEVSIPGALVFEVR